MSNTEKTFGWCFIGAGNLAHDVADQITRSGRHRVVSVYTRSHSRSCEFAEKYGANACMNAEDAINAPNVDAVYVVTPHNSHYEYTKLALELGKSVLCEKPFTTDAEKAEELIALAKEKKLYLAEAMWTWFAPTANKVKEWLDGGEFGDIENVSVSYRCNISGYASRLTDPDRAGGALLDIGVYPITYLYRLFGKPTSIACSGVLEDGVDMGEDVTMTFGDMRTYTASICMNDKNGTERLAVEGTKAMISLPFFHCTNVVTLERRDGTKEHFSGDGSMLNEFDIVVSEIREGLAESRFVPHKSTLDVMHIMDECRRQLGLVYPFETK